MHVIVIGAGLSGTLTALKLVEDPATTVTLLEIGSEILPETSSSINECYRLHMGLHYAKDLYTATNCLHRSIEFARAFPAFVAGHDTPNAPWRRGRHYVMSNSLVSVQHVRKIAIELSTLYRKLVAEDEANKVFGDPDSFIRYLTPDEYSHLATSIPFHHQDARVESISVACAIETGESQVDMPGLKADLKLKIAQHDRIDFCPFNEVLAIEQDKDTLEYMVRARGPGAALINYAGITVVNCAWQNIEKLNQTLGIETEDQHRVNRLKASILVDLPVELRTMNSSIFSLGPYACITVMPNGTAVLTSERTTNIASFPAGPGADSSADIHKHVSELTLDTASGQAVARQILEDCASYFTPELAEKLRYANILELRLGFVKLMENDSAYTVSSIYQADSVIHARPKEGIESHRLGYISNAGMKMIYTVGNAERVSSTLQLYLRDLGQRNFAMGRCSPTLFGPNAFEYGLSLMSVFTKVAKKVRYQVSDSSSKLFDQSLNQSIPLTRSKSLPILSSLSSPLAKYNGPKSP